MSAKAASANGTAAPKKKFSAPPSTNGSATPTSAEKKDTLAGTHGRPDKKVHDAEQERIKGEIDAVQTKLNAVREKISLATKGGVSNDRRNALRAELDGIRDKQSTQKVSRAKVLDQIKTRQESITKRIKDLSAAKSKIPYKNASEVDDRIKSLEKQVESGSMKLADEKRALQEISTCKRNRRVVEGFQADQDAITAERQAIDELKSQLDDPAFKASSDRYDAIKGELDTLKREGEEAYNGRAKLFEERDALQAQANTLWSEKREISQAFKDANDKYWTKINEERTRRLERQRAQRAAEESQKKLEIAERLREEASMPAFQSSIEDCQTIIDSLLGKNSGPVTLKSIPGDAKTEMAGVPQLELRKVDDSSTDGLVARKKKGEVEDDYFVGKSKKAKGKKSAAKTNGSNGAEGGNFQITLQLLSALLSFSIPPPANAADVTRVVADLTTKKAWFEANQKRVTEENIAKAEAEIKQLTMKDIGSPETATPEVSTPADTTSASSVVSFDDTEDKPTTPVDS